MIWDHETGEQEGTLCKRTQYLKAWNDDQTSRYHFKLAKLRVGLAGLLCKSGLHEYTLLLPVIFRNKQRLSVFSPFLQEYKSQETALIC